MSLGATGEYFSDEDCAAKILPLVCPLLLDKEKLIRDSANRAIDTYLHKIRAAATDMPETALPPPQAAGAAAPRMATPKSGESAGWSGWAISSFTNKLSSAAGDMQTNGSGAATPKPAPSPGPDSRRPQTASASTLHRQAVASPTTESSRGTSPNPTAMAQAFLPDDNFDDGGDSWGDMGDMGDMDENDDSSNRPSTSNDKPTPQTSSSATPFDDGEPDFGAWLAERSGKKPGAKPLPKGLSKSASNVATKKAVTKKPAARKIDLKPKEDDDDGGWGEGW